MSDWPEVGGWVCTCVWGHNSDGQLVQLVGQRDRLEKRVETLGEESDVGWLLRISHVECGEL